MANDESLTIELWTEFAIGMSFLFLRVYARWKTVGARNLYWDDLFTGITAVNWILETTFLYTLGIYGNNIGLNAETAMQVPDSEVPRLIKGSKLAFAAWIFYIGLVWSLKAVLLFLYNRMTMGLWQQRLVRIMTVFSIVTFVASMLLHFCECTPIERSWQIKPYPGDNCTIRKLNYIVIEALNILTDIGIISIPLPIIFGSRIPTHRKIILGLLFSSGAFVMVAAILRAYYSVKNIQTLNVALGWASREVFVGTIAVSAPSINSLFNTSKWFGSSKRSGGNRNNSSNVTGQLSTFPWSTKQETSRNTNVSISAAERPSGQFELNSVGWPKRAKGVRRSSSGESQEHIIDADGNGTGENEMNNKNLAIHVTTEYTLEQTKSSSSSQKENSNTSDLKQFSIE